MHQYNEFTLPNGFTFRMVSVSGTGKGSFTMGSPEDDPEHDKSEAQHPVCLSDFQLGEFAVTQALWETVLGNNPARFKGDRRPVEQVSWWDAVVFCNALSTMLGKDPCYYAAQSSMFGLGENKRTAFGWNGKRWQSPNKGDVQIDFKANGFRLPTEAEWEYAARGGSFAPSMQPFPERDYKYAGSDLLEQVGWFRDNCENQTHDVGLLLPNTLGIYDLSGNVWDWCHDWYGQYPTKLEPNPKGPAKGPGRVLRGGGWHNSLLKSCMSAYRYYFPPVSRHDFLGFRLALQGDRS